jgi:hypothetical protein
MKKLEELAREAVDSVFQVHKTPKLSKRTLGLRINFNVPLIKNGLHRVVNNHPSH